MENTSKILEKLAKLKALYENAKLRNEGEANAAAAAIQRLLLNYNLSMEDIDGVNLNSKSDVWVHEYISGYTQKSIGGQWELELWKVLCDFNFCKVFMCGNSYKNLMLVGKKENLDNIKWLNNFLQTVFVKLSKVRYKEYCSGLDFTKPAGRDTFQRNYLYGCACGLRKKLKDETATIDAEKVTALVVRSNDAIMSYVTDMFGRVGTKHSAMPKNYAAQKMGYKDGIKIKIGKPLEKKKSTELLK